ncbi:hypothetical protein [Neorhizobium sp. NCHU2750]|uniref:hypothetical protein n=1 Tax=Neorhizobium sp. NCHU2750 TaxID=1825976 RepID=UPI000E73DF70|nr:hypothetical protein NCHU2750_22630 [Neorhizobium sp. NCHU2750]
MQTYSALPPITMPQTSAKSEPHPLRAVFVTVISVKLVVCALLIATASLAPPVAAGSHYSVAASE